MAIPIPSRPVAGPLGGSGPRAWAVVLAALLLACSGPGLAQEPQTLQRYQQRMQAWFERLDRNRDGRLTPRESQGQPFLETNFQRLDRRGRGYLLPTDLAPRQKVFLGVRVRTVFARADRNGDGQLSRQEARSFPWLNRRFLEIDLNRDGAVSLQELWESRRALAPRP